jgi:AraC-like DNA-binding protein
VIVNDLPNGDVCSTLNYQESAFTLPALADALMSLLPSANRHLANLHDKESIRHLAKLDRSRTIERVKAAIIEELASGDVSVKTVAKALHVSTRTLHRMLQK